MPARRCRSRSLVKHRIAFLLCISKYTRNSKSQARLSDFVSSLAHRIAKFPAAGIVAVKGRVNAIALAPVEDFRRDSDLFGEGVQKPEAQSRFQAAFKRGFQTRDAEMNLARLFGELGGN